MNKIAVSVSFLILLFFFNRGFAYFDEGFILHGAQRVLQGEVPYKDFDLIYTPGSIYLTAVAFRSFGESILTGRILMFLVGLLTSYLIYTISFRATKNSLISLISLLIYLAWGPTHINFPWPSMLALTAGVSVLWALPNYYLVGLLTSVVFLMKQNFGIAVFLSAVIGLGWIKGIRRRRGMRELFLGIITGLAPFLGHLLFTNSLVGFLDNFYFYTIKRFFLERAASTHFPAGLKGIFYLLPAFISLAAIFVTYKRQKKLLILPIFTLLFYLFGIRPTSDYPHLVVLMSTVGIPIAVIIANFQIPTHKKQTTRFIWTTCWLASGAFLIVLGFHTALFKNYYRWDSPLVKQNQFISDPRALIFVDQKFSRVVPEVVAEIRKATRPADYIFIFPNASMFYFLTERKNPTRFIGLARNIQTSAQEREVVRDLQLRQVRLVLTNEEVEESGYKIIKKYILENFEKKKEIFEFSLWERI